MRPVVFDLEGTLVDFQWELEAAEAQARNELTEMGLDEVIDESKSYAELYNDGLDAAERAGLDRATVARRLDDIYDEFDARALDAWSLRDGARTAVARVQETALVTNVGRDAVEALLERTGLDFDPVITRNDVGRLKPDPAGLERASEALGGDPLFVGDSVTDARAGSRAGLEVAIVTGGESAVEAVEASDPSYHLDSLRHLESLL